MANRFPFALLVLLSSRASCVFGFTIYGARVHKKNGSVELLTTDSDEGTLVECVTDFLLLAKDSTSGNNFSAGFTLENPCNGDYCHLHSKHVPVWIPNSLGHTESGLSMLNTDIFLKSFTFDTYFVNTLHELGVYDRDPAAQIRTYLRVWLEPSGVDVSRQEDEDWLVMTLHDVSWVVKIHPEEAFSRLQGWARRYAADTVPSLVEGNASHPYAQLRRAALGQALAFFIHDQAGFTMTLCESRRSTGQIPCVLAWMKQPGPSSLKVWRKLSTW